MVDTATGSAGNDTLIGGNGADVLHGSEGIDILKGNVDNDTLNGNTGNDDLDGGTGVDIISGNEDNDSLTGPPADMVVDTVNGGAGSDTCQQGLLLFADTVTVCSPYAATPKRRCRTSRGPPGSAARSATVARADCCSLVTQARSRTSS